MDINKPPLIWKEHWFEHTQMVSLVFYDHDVVIYFDDDMDRSINWLNYYVGDAWRYTRQVYGDMNPTTNDQRLWAIFHQDKYSGGHPSYYFDASHDYRNVIDLGQYGSWQEPTGWALDATMHEISHIVESTTNSVIGSPAFAIWGDSKWSAIYQYDVYMALGWESEARRWYDIHINDPWFRDWFFPIWSDHGRGAVLSGFFKMLSQYFPKNNQHYVRDMNLGEFIHFWSGAAGSDLAPLAKKAFGWSQEWENQLKVAKINFNKITY